MKTMITKEMIFKLLKDAKSGDEQTMDILFESIILLLLEIRDAVKQQESDTYTQPTDNPDDIIVGGIHINNTETR